MLDDIHVEQRSSKVLLVVLVLMYIGFSIYIPMISMSRDSLMVGGKLLPVSSFSGVISSIVSLSLILMVVFYRELGYHIALGLSLLQFPMQIVSMLRAPVLSGLPGFFSNILVIFATTVIHINYRRLSRSQQEMREQAALDSLTGLPNRFACSRLVEQLVHERKPFTLVSINLKNFRGINNLMGHEAGDQTLVAVADRWKVLAAESDMQEFVARVSGNGFYLIIRNYASGEEVLQVIGRYREEMEKTLTINGSDFHLQGCFGYAEYPDDAATPDQLMTYADVAMSMSRDSGTGKPILRFTASLLSSERDMEIENTIRDVLEKDLVLFNLQPQFDVQHRLRGFEALARMKDGEGNVISPGEFIPVAEKAGLVSRIDSAVFRKSAAFFGEVLCRTGAEIILSVNVSVQHLMRKDFISEVQAILAEYRIPAERIEIEITESIMIDSMGEALRCVNELKKLGLRIAIDDFGTGYSSLSYLNQIPADLLKVDKSFIDRMNDSESSCKYVAAIISIGHIMSLEVIAEGIEETAQMETLREIGCDFIQGFLWGRPMPPEEAEKLIAQSVSAAVS